MKIEFLEQGPSAAITITSCFLRSDMHNSAVLLASQIAPGCLIRDSGFWFRKTIISGHQQDLRKAYMIIYLMDR